MKTSIITWIFLILGLTLLCCEREKNDLPTDGDGNTYDTVVIGQQTWLAENLKTTKYINGNPISLVTDDAEWSTRTQGAYCWWQNNINFKDDYGALYNGYVARMNELLCPTGYHVPTMDEWLTLISFLGNSSEEIKQSFKTKKFGFRLGDGPFYPIHSSWWSVKESPYSLDAIETSFQPWITGIKTGLSIRCIKNN
jgi:uncharacterized protein (TIGR02145 family)